MITRSHKRCYIIILVMLIAFVPVATGAEASNEAALNKEGDAMKKATFAGGSVWGGNAKPTREGLKKRLTPLQLKVTQECGTEPD